MCVGERIKGLVLSRQASIAELDARTTAERAKLKMEVTESVLTLTSIPYEDRIDIIRELFYVHDIGGYLLALVTMCDNIEYDKAKILSGEYLAKGRELYSVAIERIGSYNFPCLTPDCIGVITVTGKQDLDSYRSDDRSRYPSHRRYCARCRQAILQAEEQKRRKQAAEGRVKTITSKIKQLNPKLAAISAAESIAAEKEKLGSEMAELIERYGLYGPTEAQNGS